MAFKTLVCPQFEYAIAIWDLHAKGNIRELEMVQRCAAQWTMSNYARAGSGTSLLHQQGAVARSEACPLGMQAAPTSIPTSGTFFRGDLAMKNILRPFSLFRWFKKSSC